MILTVFQEFKFLLDTWIGVHYLETPLIFRETAPQEGMADIDELSSDSDDEEYIPEGIQLANSPYSWHLRA